MMTHEIAGQISLRRITDTFPAWQEILYLCYKPCQCFHAYRPRDVFKDLRKNVTVDSALRWRRNNYDIALIRSTCTMPCYGRGTALPSLSNTRPSPGDRRPTRDLSVRRFQTCG
ncbi:hypothetical protein Bbelb_337320 [Branchiostoma belcheri]|nr:hypothetical protein Bbelb_337320 [Branchiostoma belcheri]